MRLLGPMIQTHSEKRQQQKKKSYLHQPWTNFYHRCVHVKLNLYPFIHIRLWGLGGRKDHLVKNKPSRN